MKRLLLYALPALLWAGLLFWLSAQPSLPTISTMSQFDKVEHLGAYGVLGALLYRALRGYGIAVGRALVLAAAGGALYGVSDEFHQWFVPNRTADVFDALADAAGSALGGAAWLGLERLARAARRP